MLVPDEPSETPPVNPIGALGALDLMDLLITNQRSETNYDGETAEEEDDVRKEACLDAQQKRVILPTPERLSVRINPALIKSAFCNFNCPPKCPSGGKCLTSGLVTIDSATKCRVMNMQRGSLHEIKKHLVGRVIGFRLVIEV